MQRRVKKYIAAGLMGTLAIGLYTAFPAPVFGGENAAALTAGVERVLERDGEERESTDMPTDNAVVLASGEYEDEAEANTAADFGGAETVQTAAEVYEDEPAGDAAQGQQPEGGEDAAPVTATDTKPLAETQAAAGTELSDGAQAAAGTEASDEAAAAGSAVAISAPSAILVEASTGAVLYEKNPDEVLRPASITKIMTLILIFDALKEGKIKLDDMVSVSDYAASMGGSQVFFEPGETQTVDTMIKCITVASANDACAAYREGKHIT